ncbi:hypothetical protein ABK040_011772 [Willaertia magna]
MKLFCVLVTLFLLAATVIFARRNHNQQQQRINQQTQQPHLKQVNHNNNIKDDTVNILFKINYQTQLFNNNSIIFSLRGNIYPLSWQHGISLNYNQSTDSYDINLDFNLNDLKQLILEVKVLINDKDWMIGPNAEFKFENLMANRNYIVKLFPWFYTTEGSIVTFSGIYSPQLNNYRNISIYLPPSFNENLKKSYENILIMHDGQNLFDPKTAFLNNAWMCQNTLNQLINNNDYMYSIPEIIVIGIDNTNDRMNEYTYSKDPKYKVGGSGDLYLDFIETIVLPFVTKSLNNFNNQNILTNYQISKNQNLKNNLKNNFKNQNLNDRIPKEIKNLGILGSSLGGLISCYAGWTRSHLYNRVGCMSSSFWWNNQDFNTTILTNKNIRPPIKNNLKFYLDSGNEGEDQDGMLETKIVLNHFENFPNHLFELKRNLFYFLDRGASHNEYFWGKRFWAPLLALFDVEPEILN